MQFKYESLKRNKKESPIRKITCRGSRLVEMVGIEPMNATLSVWRSMEQASKSIIELFL